MMTTTKRIVKAAGIEREAVLLGLLEGCNKGSAVKGLVEGAGSRICGRMTVLPSWARDWLLVT